MRCIPSEFDLAQAAAKGLLRSGQVVRVNHGHRPLTKDPLSDGMTVNFDDLMVTRIDLDFREGLFDRSARALQEL
jgi:hypothetical protein